MIFVGTKFYRYTDDSDKPEIVRILKYQNETTVKVRNESTKEEYKIALDELKTKYIKISISGLMVFSKVTIGNGNDDIIVSLYRNKELDMKSTLPYCVCRQGITDIFYQMTRTDKNFYGASVSVDTIPSGIEFDIMVACDAVYQDSIQYVAVYMNDTLDDIIDMVNTKEFDKTLNLMYLDHVTHESSKYGKVFYETMLKCDNCEGYVRSLKGLLDSTNFMFDFYRGFEIYPLDFDLDGYDQQALPDNYKSILSDLICKNIDKALVIKYDHDIQFSLIKKDYVMISDKNGVLYLITFTTSGVYFIPVEKYVSDKNIEVLHHKMNTTSIQKAYEHVLLNKNKYL